MVAQDAAASDLAIISRWRRDYRLSLWILVVGLVVVVALAGFSFWANLTGNYPTSFGGGLAIRLIGTAGGMLFFVGGIFAYHNWSLLRQSRTHRVTVPTRKTD